MKLITKKIENELAKYPLYSQDGKGKEAVAICKFFLQGFTWYVLEAQKRTTAIMSSSASLTA